MTDMTSPNEDVLQRLSTALLSDAMDELGLPSNATGNLVVFAAARPVVGRAFTLRQQIVDGRAEAMGRQGEAAARLASPGDVLVIDAEAHPGCATWGEAHTLRAMRNRLAGVAINGMTRDSAAITDRGFPLICRGATPIRSKGRLQTAELRGQVSVGDTAIAHGDLVCFDQDGIVAIPAEVENDVLQKAAEIRALEAERDKHLSNTQLSGYSEV
jgi:regulator of RNase E activity RraA